MRILSIGISHKTAPVSVREAIAFTKRKQSEILRFIKENIAEECVIISTCNRCEFYLVSKTDVCGEFISYVKMLVAEVDLERYIEVYTDIDAVWHLARMTTGLLSMIMGEDQILGQVKEAHAFAMENKTSGVYLNKLFRIAVTGAKRVKTDTLLSKTPVSAATIAIKLCEEILGSLDGKTAMIIGASGKMGSIVYKDMLSLGKLNLLVTTRTHKPSVTDGFHGAKIIDYDKRYEYLDHADIVVSATASPHCTLRADLIKKSLVTKKDRVFIDLAVPKDIEEGEGYIYKNIDCLRELSEINNQKKLEEAVKAEKILEKYVNEFMVWKIFHENRELADRVEFKRKIYDAKSKMNYTEFDNFIEGLKHD